MAGKLLLIGSLPRTMLLKGTQIVARWRPKILVKTNAADKNDPGAWMAVEQPPNPKVILVTLKAT